VICKGKAQKQEVEAQIADQEVKYQLFVATCFANRSSSESWLIDSGFTNHMTHNKELFKELESTTITKVRIGNGDHIVVKGKCTIAIESCLGTKTIFDVLYVPEIDQNFLSVGQLIKKGLKVIFEDKHCLIKDAAGQEMFKVRIRGKSFFLDTMEEKQVAFPISESTTQVWHKRLGHFHHTGVLYMQRKQFVQDLPPLEEHLPSCQACQFGKQTRLPFPKTSWRATQKLQLIHTDLAGPQRTHFLKGSLYYIVFIDNLTRMCWIFFLKFNSEVVVVFWKFKSNVENQSGCKI